MRPPQPAHRPPRAAPRPPAGRARPEGEAHEARARVVGLGHRHRGPPVAEARPGRARMRSAAAWLCSRRKGSPTSGAMSGAARPAPRADRPTRGRSHPHARPGGDREHGVGAGRGGARGSRSRAPRGIRAGPRARATSRAACSSRAGHSGSRGAEACRATRRPPPSGAASPSTRTSASSGARTDGTRRPRPRRGRRLDHHVLVLARGVEQLDHVPHELGSRAAGRASIST